MNQPSIYRLWSSYFLLLLILWTSKGQAMGALNCLCTTSITSSCCAVEKSPKKDCSSAKKDCTNSQLSKCCCVEEVEQQALLPLQEKVSLFQTTPLLPPLLEIGSKGQPVNSIDWEQVAPIPWRHYQSPLLYRDVPIFVQSFLL